MRDCSPDCKTFRGFRGRIVWKMWKCEELPSIKDDAQNNTDKRSEQRPERFKTTPGDGPKSTSHSLDISRLVTVGLLLTRAKYCRPVSSDIPFLICMNIGCRPELMVAMKSSSLSLFDWAATTKSTSESIGCWQVNEDKNATSREQSGDGLDLWYKVDVYIITTINICRWNIEAFASRRYHQPSLQTFRWEAKDL